MIALHSYGMPSLKNILYSGATQLPISLCKVVTAYYSSLQLASNI